MPAIPAYAQQCCQVLRGHGYAAYLVGGCVRDLLLGRQPEDWDVATSARPEQVMKLFAHTIPTGLRHGTVTVVLEGGKVEVTTFRHEGSYTDGRHPDVVSFDAGLREDLARRDFTINAMAMDAGGALIDPFGGQRDLAQKKIRCVGRAQERFSEDGLRMLRAVRFSAQLEFDLEEATAAALRELAGKTRFLSAERVRVELEKTITAPCPQRGELLFTAGLLSPWMTEEKIPDLERLGRLPGLPLWRWGGLCALLGGTGLLERLKPDRQTLRICRGVVDIVQGGAPVTAAGWRRLAAQYGRQAAAIGSAILGRQAELEQALADNPCLDLAGLALSGRELQKMGFQGPEIGRIQRALLEHVLEHPQDNRADLLAERVLALQPFINKTSMRP